MYSLNNFNEPLMFSPPFFEDKGGPKRKKIKTDVQCYQIFENKQPMNKSDPLLSPLEIPVIPPTSPTSSKIESFSQASLLGNSVQKPQSCSLSLANLPTFDRTVVVEIYNPHLENTKNLTHELIANYEQGLLGKNHHSDHRFIWCLDKAMNAKILEHAAGLLDNRTVIGISNCNQENLPVFSPNTKLIIVAQGDDINYTIAGMQAEEFIEIILEDLGVTDLAELELVVCKIGNRPEYIQEIGESFPKTKIISYKCLVAVSSIDNYKIVGFDDDGQWIKDIQSAKIEFTA
jgi:hypothetical protein